jgi:hypothetical protein
MREKSVPQHNHERDTRVLGSVVALVVAIASAGRDDGQPVVVAIVVAVAGVWTDDDGAFVVVAIVIVVAGVWTDDRCEIVAVAIVVANAEIRTPRMVCNRTC